MGFGFLQKERDVGELSFIRGPVGIMTCGSDCCSLLSDCELSPSFVLGYSISHVGPICESSPTSSGSEQSKTDESRFVLSRHRSDSLSFSSKMYTCLGPQCQNHIQ